MLGDEPRSVDSRDVSTRSDHARGKAHRHEVASSRRDDRNGASHLLNAGSFDATLDDEEVNARSDQFGGQVRDIVVPVAVLTVVSDKVSTVNPTTLLHSLIEGPLVRKARRQHSKEETNPIDFPCLP